MQNITNYGKVYRPSYLVSELVEEDLIEKVHIVTVRPRIKKKLSESSSQLDKAFCENKSHYLKMNYGKTNFR